MAETYGEDAIREAVAKGEPPQEPERDGGQDLRLARFPRNDYGNARRLIERHGRDLIYVHGAGWHWWDGRRWREDRGAHHTKMMAHRTALAIKEELKAVEREGDGAFASEKAYASFRKSLKDWARSSGNSARINAMVEVAAPYQEKEISDLDTHAYLFNVNNGTLDLSGEEIVLTRHERSHYITHLAEVDYDPDVPCRRFDDFLHTVMPDAPLQTFLQRYFGYCLTGDTSEQKLLLCHGGGGNGKSTLNNALRAVFGDYATGVQFETLQQDDRKRGSDATPDIAELPGRRLVIASEPNGSVKMSTAVIKRLTGGEPIKARKR